MANMPVIDNRLEFESAIMHPELLSPEEVIEDNFSRIKEQELPSQQLETKESDNVIFIVAGKLGLEAIEDKILVLIDKFKSGYECKDCNETGIFTACECSRRREFGVNQNNKTCAFRDACARQQVGTTCRTCNGTGSTLIMPENARAIPTSGVIVSIGPDCKTRAVGERVLFGAHTGYYLPFKGSAKIRVMREDEPMCKIYALNNNEVLGDFIQIEEHQS